MKLKHLFFKYYGLIVGLSTSITVITTIIMSLFYNYKITIYVAGPIEAMIEIVVVGFGITALIYEILRKLRQPKA